MSDLYPTNPRVEREKFEIAEKHPESVGNATRRGKTGREKRTSKSRYAREKAKMQEGSDVTVKEIPRAANEIDIYELRSRIKRKKYLR